MGGGRARGCPRAGTNESSHGQATDRPVGAASLELGDRPGARPRSRGPKCENEVSYGVWRSPVARVIWDHEVESSNLSTPTAGHGNAQTSRCYRTARPADCTQNVAIGTHELALLDLFQYSVSGSAPDHRTHVRDLLEAG